MCVCVFDGAVAVQDDRWRCSGTVGLAVRAPPVLHYPAAGAAVAAAGVLWLWLCTCAWCKEHSRWHVVVCRSRCHVSHAVMGGSTRRALSWWEWAVHQ